MKPRYRTVLASQSAMVQRLRTQIVALEGLLARERAARMSAEAAAHRTRLTLARLSCAPQVS